MKDILKGVFGIVFLPLMLVVLVLNVLFGVAWLATPPKRRRRSYRK